MNYRKSLIFLHTVLASFFLPMGILYALTGGLYSIGIKGAYHTTEHTLTLDQPLQPELSALVRIVEQDLTQRGIDLPTGSASIKNSGTSYHLEWTGTRRDIELHPTAHPNTAQLKIKDTTPHRFFVQLHKAKGGPLFKWFAATWMVGLILLFVTGGAMAWLARPYRKIAALSTAAGLITFIALALVS